MADTAFQAGADTEAVHGGCLSVGRSAEVMPDVINFALLRAAASSYTSNTNDIRADTFQRGI